ncbi:MAG: type II toxin-antitoxin system Phd/YefM family antitoxin [Xanthomonadales bacterium]|nr:type II toxin-antitoxin system Phd/YefM family antitoxin [Xanthomonadales bacterium]
MTRKRTTKMPVAARVATGSWRLQDAKARFSEVVRLASSEGPQRVTLHGREAVVVVDADAFRRMQGEPSGEQLVDALKASPYRDLDLQPSRQAMPVRSVQL